MKVKTISYSRVFSMPNYQNQKVGIEIEVSDGDRFDEVYEFAVEFVESRNPAKIKEIEDLENKKLEEGKVFNSKKIVASPEDYTEVEVIEAIKFIRNYRKDDLPF